MKNPLKIFPGTVEPPIEIRDPVDEFRHPKEAKKHFASYVRNEILVLNFYRTHMIYFIVVILISSVILYGEGIANDSDEISGSRLRYIDSLFLCCSAMTTTGKCLRNVCKHRLMFLGLNTVNLGDITAFQQAVLAILLLVGNVTFVSTFVVLIRRHFFRRKLADMVNHSRAARKVIGDIEKQGLTNASQLNHTTLVAKTGSSADVSGHVASDTTRRRRLAVDEAELDLLAKKRTSLHHQTGLGTFPAPWEIDSVRRVVSYPFHKLASDLKHKSHSYISFDAKFDKRGRFRELNELERCELGGVEYRALGSLLYILTAYQIFWLVLGTVLLVPYSYRPEIVDILNSEQPGNLNPGWFAFFSVITGYCNGGLNLLNANFIPLYKSYFILIVEGALTVAGNTQFPILLRLLIWTMSKIISKNSSFSQTLQFLLHHPRRCFIYLFPSKETWYLLIIQVSIDLTMWILFELLNIGLPAVKSIPSNIRVFDGLFQATGLRTSGAYIITISSLAPALLVAYLIAMYVKRRM
jgi:Trk-type K+ transport system membrane component